MEKNSYLIGLSKSRKIDFGKTKFQTQSAEQRVFSAYGRLRAKSTTVGFRSIFQAGMVKLQILHRLRFDRSVPTRAPQSLSAPSSWYRN
jgi:hypothetical protein